MLLDQHLELVYLNLVLSSYNIFWSSHNVVDKQFYNHLLDQLQSFKCVHFFSYHFLLADQKRLFHLSLNHNQLFLWLEENMLYVMFYLCSNISNDKTKSLVTPWKLGSIKWSKYRYSTCVDIFDWYLFKLIVCLNPDFNCCSSFALSSVDKVQLELKILYQLL